MCREWGVRFSRIDISAVTRVFEDTLGTDPGDRLSRGNIASRSRMVILFDIARREKGLVVGTTNRSEYLMGYMTKFGDGAEDVMPLANFYKTQVWQIASLIGIPKHIIDKVPTAGLWDGQSDEAELGVSYRDLDIALYAFDRGCTDEEAFRAARISFDKVSEIRGRVGASEHKRRPALVPDAKGFRSDALAAGKGVHDQVGDHGENESRHEHSEPLGRGIFVTVVEYLRKQIACDDEQEYPRGEGDRGARESGLAVQEHERDHRRDRRDRREQAHGHVRLLGFQDHRHGRGYGEHLHELVHAHRRKEHGPFDAALHERDTQREAVERRVDEHAAESRPGGELVGVSAAVAVVDPEVDGEYGQESDEDTGLYRGRAVVLESFLERFREDHYEQDPHDQAGAQR